MSQQVCSLLHITYSPTTAWCHFSTLPGYNSPKQKNIWILTPCPNILCRKVAKHQITTLWSGLTWLNSFSNKLPPAIKIISRRYLTAECELLCGGIFDKAPGLYLVNNTNSLSLPSAGTLFGEKRQKEARSFTLSSTDATKVHEIIYLMSDTHRYHSSTYLRELSIYPGGECPSLNLLMLHC